jgi:hypothetical protein
LFNYPLTQGDTPKKELIRHILHASIVIFR